MPRPEVNPTAVEVARISRGMSQLELSEAIGITQGQLSKIESGVITPTKEVVEKLSSELRYPAKFFAEEIVVPPSFAIHYRKKKALTGMELQKMHYSIYVMKHIVKKLMKAVTITNRMIYMTPDEYGDPEAIANMVRQKWNIPRGPIKNLMNLVEGVGVVVLLVEYDNDDIDGEVVPDEDGLPIIFINKNRSADRIRYTLAHEFGHLIMHSGKYIVPGEVAEEEANCFASEFLMPAEDIRYQLDEKLTIAKLYDLKRYWKCSMAAIIQAAVRIGIIDSKKQGSLYAQMNNLKIRKVEPDCGVTMEYPTIVKQIFDLYFDKLNYSIDSLSEIVPLHKSEIRSIIDLYSNKTIRIATPFSNETENKQETKTRPFTMRAG